MQTLIVALVVAGCSLYAVWVLMPSALRRTLAQRLQQWPWPDALARPLRRAALAPTGCGCDGCDAKPATPGAPQTIRLHRRPRT